MSQEMPGTNFATPEVPSGKRKRGRPRKDDSLSMLRTPGSDVMRRNCRSRVDSVEYRDGALMGQMVSGALDGSFDAGYLITVRVGDTGIVLRGLVFEPGLSVPISATNDVAPHVRMIKRNEVPLPVTPLNQVPVSVVERPRTRPIDVNGAADPRDGSHPIYFTKSQDDVSGPSSRPMNGGHVSQVTALKVQSESKNDLKVEISSKAGASQSEVEKGIFVKSMLMQETSLPPKGADSGVHETKAIMSCSLPSEDKPNASTQVDIVTSHPNGQSVETQAIMSCSLPSEDKINASTQMAVLTTHANRPTDVFSKQSPSINLEPSMNKIVKIEISQENDTSVQIGVSSNNRAAHNHIKVESTTAAPSLGTLECGDNARGISFSSDQIPEIPKVREQEVPTLLSLEVSQDIDSAIGRSDALRRVHETEKEALSQESVIDAKEIQRPLLATEDITVVASNDIQKPHDTSEISTGSLSNIAKVQNEDLNLESKMDEPAADAEMLQADATPVEKLTNNVKPDVAQTESNYPADATIHSEDPSFSNNAEVTQAELRKADASVPPVVSETSLQEIISTPEGDARCGEKVALLNQKVPQLPDLMAPALSEDCVCETSTTPMDPYSHG